MPVGGRVLLLSAAKDDRFPVTRVHMGLSLLASILTEAGHQALIVDYSYLKSVAHRVRAPRVEEVIDDFEPDVVGISVFTYLYDEARELIARVSASTDAPIVLGGPHLTMFPDDFVSDRRVSYVVRGEAESVILDIVENARPQAKARVIDAPVPGPDAIPRARVEAALGHEHLSDMQIQLSRGCPFHCTFCNIEQVAGRKVRARSLETCLQEIVEAKKRLPQLAQIVISDDCPTYDVKRFKRFLKMLRDARLGCGLKIDNLRADSLDEELVVLCKEAGGINLCLGVESGHADVFRATRKSETLEEIERAAGLIRKHGMVLGLCFVIGLPGDTWERHQESVRFAKRLKPSYVFWNACVPWPGTCIREWYAKNGEVGEIRNYSSLMDYAVSFRPPVCSSPSFTREEITKAWLQANLETHPHFSRVRDLPRLARLSARYGLYGAFGRFLTRNFPRAFLRDAFPAPVRQVLRRLPPGVLRRLRSTLNQ